LLYLSICYIALPPFFGIVYLPHAKEKVVKERNEKEKKKRKKEKKKKREKEN
jgi:hypothetical protein